MSDASSSDGSRTELPKSSDIGLSGIINAITSGLTDVASAPSGYLGLVAMLGAGTVVVCVVGFVAGGEVQVAALIMFGVVILAILGVLVFFVQQHVPGSDPQVVPLNVGAVTIESRPNTPSRPGPDGGYTVPLPPSDWTYDPVPRVAWMAERSGFSETYLRGKLKKSGYSDRWVEATVAVFKRSASTREVTPLPGRTLINGAQATTALSIRAATDISIIPMERYVQPLFCELPLEQRLLVELAPAASLMVMSPGGIQRKKTAQGHEVRAISMSQRLDHALVDDDEDTTITLYLDLMAVEGVEQDYLLVLRHYALGSAVSAESAVIRTMVEGFEVSPPSHAADPASQQKEAVEAWWNDHGQEVYRREFQQFALQAQPADVEDVNKLVTLLRRMRPFQLAADLVKFDNPRLQQMWPAMEKARHGDLADFKELLPALLEEAASPDSASAARPSDPTEPSLSLPAT